MAPHKQTRKIIHRLLNTIGSEQEIQQYLKRYADLEAEKFAVVKVGGAVLASQLAAFTSALVFLQRVGLTPIVVHGAGPQLTSALADAGIKSHIDNGYRVTTPEVLKYARKVFLQQNMAIVDSLRAAETNAASITSGVIEAEILDDGRYGMVGKITDVNLDVIRHALAGGLLPIVSPLGETADGQIVNINADVVTNALVRAVQPYKVIFLTDTGGILNEQGNIISSINLSTDLEELLAQPWLHSGMRVKVEQIANLLRDLPETSSVSITRPDYLARELFTHKGSGTLIRVGESINTYKDWAQIDQARLRGLIENSFGRALAHDYAQNKPLLAAYISANYRAAAIITANDGLPWLDKFAVTDKAQGEGLGKAVWSAVRAAYPQLYWRARPDNPINGFYFRHADGVIKTPDWNVFWYGIEDLQQVARCVATAAQTEATLS
ncbi:MAG: acetylglutamate kinase [Gammaproteobacteria bacterium]|nr:acetylglutamate kinase [Gammaproteobacteria bacterium]